MDALVMGGAGVSDVEEDAVDSLDLGTSSGSEVDRRCSISLRPSVYCRRSSHAP